MTREGHAEPRPYQSLTLYSEIETFWIQIIHRQNITINWDQTDTNLKMLYPQNALVLVLVLVHLWGCIFFTLSNIKKIWQLHSFLLHFRQEFQLKGRVTNLDRNEKIVKNTNLMLLAMQAQSKSFKPNQTNNYCPLHGRPHIAGCWMQIA